MQRNKLPRRILEWEPGGTRRKEEPKKDGWMDGIRRSTTEHGLTEGDTKERVKSFV
jgi:hypothetical protein